MAYIYQNKVTNELRLFGSVKSLSEATGIKPDNLYHNFGRKGLNMFETNLYKIVKTKIERA